MDRRLILLVLAVALSSMGCGSSSEPMGKPMNAEEEAKLKENQYTPEEQAMRSNRPR